MISRRAAAFPLLPSRCFLLCYTSRQYQYRGFTTITETSVSSTVSDSKDPPSPPSERPVILNFEEQSKLIFESIKSLSARTLNPQIKNNQPLTQFEQYQIEKAARETANKLGVVLEPHYKPHELITNPPSPSEVTLEALLAAGAHLGHATALWNPANQRYIFGIRQGIHLISLDVILAHLRRAAKIVHGVSQAGGIIVFVGTRDGHERAVVEAARRARGYHITERWVPGTVTNKDQLLIDQKLRVVDSRDREIRLTRRQKEGLQATLANDKDTQGAEPVQDTLQVPHKFGAVRPDLVICLNPLENQTMLHECTQYRIPTIGIVDTDVDPTCVTYPIPANDDSLRSVQLIAGVLGRAGQEGRLARYEADEEREEELEKTRKADRDKKQRERDESGRDQMHNEAEEAASEARQREIEQESELDPK
ncbi:37S ribosomal protein, mitochondrial [Orbilia ellipsospora]|uniref:37S ribosomal protein, mitochondrial n=1 Tax=Orbilia ellipsospora TaxID=2528407 RepID=A0AAV9XNQ8_9PEZI